MKIMSSPVHSWIQLGAIFIMIIAKCWFLVSLRFMESIKQHGLSVSYSTNHSALFLGSQMRKTIPGKLHMRIYFRFRSCRSTSKQLTSALQTYVYRSHCQDRFSRWPSTTEIVATWAELFTASMDDQKDQSRKSLRDTGYGGSSRTTLEEACNYSNRPEEPQQERLHFDMGTGRLVVNSPPPQERPALPNRAALPDRPVLDQMASQGFFVNYWILRSADCWSNRVTGWMLSYNSSFKYI